jgi:hypothetical protein
MGRTSPHVTGDNAIQDQTPAGRVDSLPQPHHAQLEELPLAEFAPPSSDPKSASSPWPGRERRGWMLLKAVV